MLTHTYHIHTLSVDETSFLGSEEDCPYVGASFGSSARVCFFECKDGDESWGGGIFSQIAYRSPFDRILDDLRADIRSIEVDGDVVLFDDISLNSGANTSCTCDGEVTVIDDCTSPNVVCTTTYELEPTLRVQWAASFDTKLQTATSTLTLFVNTSASSLSNITVGVGFDKALKSSADGEPLSYSTKTTTATVFMHDENDEELQIQNSKLVVEPELPKTTMSPHAGLVVRPPQKVVFVSVPIEMDSYSVGIVSTLSVSSAVIYDATYSFALFLILQLFVSTW